MWRKYNIRAGTTIIFIFISVCVCVFTFVVLVLCCASDVLVFRIHRGADVQCSATWVLSDVQCSATWVLFDTHTHRW